MGWLTRRTGVACVAGAAAAVLLVLAMSSVAVRWQRVQGNGLGSSTLDSALTEPAALPTLAAIGSDAADDATADAAAMDAAIPAGIIPADAFQSVADSDIPTPGPRHAAATAPEPGTGAIPARGLRVGVRSAVALEPLAPTTAHVRVTCPRGVANDNHDTSCVPAAAMPLLDTARIPMYTLNGHLVNELGEPWMVLQVVVPSYNASEAHPNFTISLNATAYFGVAGDLGRSTTVHAQTDPVREQRTMPLQAMPPDLFSASHLHVVHRVKLPRAAVLERARQQRPPTDAARFWAALTITVDYTFVQPGAGNPSVPLSLHCAFVVPTLALPDDCALDVFADLLDTAQNATRAPAPTDLVLCLGPITAVGASPMHFWNYTVAYFEHHRRVGVARIMFYFNGVNRGASAVVAALMAAYADDPLVEFMDTSTLDRVARTTYHNQYVLLNHCLNSVKGRPRFVYACDLDELLVVTGPGNVPDALALLWARRTAQQSQFVFNTADDNTLVANVCMRDNTTATTYADATAHMHTRIQHSTPLAALDYFVVNATCRTENWCQFARRKTISLAAPTRILMTHDSVGGKRGPTLASVGLAKLHARGLPFRQPACSAWADTWLAAPESDGAARVHRRFFPPDYLRHELASKQPFFTL